MRDDLHEPLGLAPHAAGRGWRLDRRAVVLAGVAVIALGAYAALRHAAPLGGEPYAVAKIEAAPTAPAAPPATPLTAASAETGLPARASGGEIDAASGVKVMRSGGASPPNAMIIDVAQALGVRLEPAPDKRLVEKSRYGALPRVGADGARPFEVYARPSFTAGKLKSGAPRVALMVGGLGLNAEGTANAVARLPGAVSLGFAPYGAALERQAAEAREAGHETLLQAPMEPFGYPAENPGPHTLLAAASDAENLDSLRWLMGRFPGYIGIVNYLGGRFTGEARVVAPMLNEIAARGLGFLDDGSSPRSVARDAAAALAIPNARADVVIDAEATPQAIDAALVKLEALARSRGSAIGVATAAPLSVERLAPWAAGLEAKGVALVPVSALMAKGPAPQANR